MSRRGLGERSDLPRSSGRGRPPSPGRPRKLAFARRLANHCLLVSRGRPKKGPREKDLTARWKTGALDEDRVDARQQFNRRTKFHQRNKTADTVRARMDKDVLDAATLPVGQVIQVFSLYCEVRGESGSHLCVVRRTLAKTAGTQIVVGDRVRFRLGADRGGEAEGVIEQVLPRQTVLTRADSFKALEQHPIVANAEQMLIVASIWAPFPRWGLIDRMLVAAQAGGLRPIVCLNKIDLLDSDPDARSQQPMADEALDHYATRLGVPTVRTSVRDRRGLDELTCLLRERVTALAGHSGVGKSSLILAIDPRLDLKVAPVSHVHLKGRHTTTSARYYDLAIGGAVIDTPGVKLFGLWDVTPSNLDDFFPDLDDPRTPTWRRQSHQRILESLQRGRTR